MSLPMASTQDPIHPMFSAVSSSARQLHQIMRAISFAPRAHVHITDKGLWLTVHDAKAMQGRAFLDKELFSSYTFRSSDGDDAPMFQISLEALLETLQIFGINDARDRWYGRDGGFGSGARSGSSQFSRAGSVTGNNGTGGALDSRVLGMSGLCRLRYEQAGAPLQVTLEETGVTTTAHLTTYEPENIADIPVEKSAIAAKIIMRASSLQDAITELATTDPLRLTLVAAPTRPFLALSANGPHGSASVQFAKDPQLLETFQVPRKVTQTYKFAMIRGAMRAMSMATKVSIRVDEPGVLSLQFMIEVDGGNVSFVDFRFVPFVPEGDDDDAVAGSEGNDADVASNGLIDGFD